MDFRLQTAVLVVMVTLTQGSVCLRGNKDGYGSWALRGLLLAGLDVLCMKLRLASRSRNGGDGEKRHDL